MFKHLLKEHRGSLKKQGLFLGAGMAVAASLCLSAMPIPATAADGTAEKTVTLTHNVILLDGNGKGMTIPGTFVEGGFINSDGDRNPEDLELQVTYEGKTTDFSTLGVRIGGIDANAEETPKVSAWRGAKNYPVVRNFGLHKFAKGSYPVEVDASAIKHWALIPKQILRSPYIQLINGKNLEIGDAYIPTLVVLFGYDSDDNGIADYLEQNEFYTPEYQLPDPILNGVALDIPAPVAAEGPLPEKTKFTIKADEGITIDPETGAIHIPEEKMVTGDIPLEVTVTYRGGSEDIINLVVSVPAPVMNEEFTPAYEIPLGESGKALEIAAPKAAEGKLPKGTKFSLDAGKGITIDSETGAISISAERAVAGLLELEVMIAYPDGSDHVLVLEVPVWNQNKPAPAPQPNTTPEGKGTDNNADTEATKTNPEKIEKLTIPQESAQTPIVTPRNKVKALPVTGAETKTLTTLSGIIIMLGIAALTISRKYTKH